MQGVMITLLTGTVTMSAVALIYMAATPFLAKRYSATGRYYAWLIIVMGLILPFRPHFNHAIVNIRTAGSTAVPIVRIGNAAPVVLPMQSEMAAALPKLSWWAAAAVVWLVGAMVFLTCQGIRHYRFLKFVARWSRDVTDGWILTLMQDLKTEMGITETVGLQFCDSIGSPMLTGLIHPRILLPKADFSEDELSLILKHELVHYKRRDLWYKCLVLAATVVHWFNPIVYLMARAIDIQCELSCDKAVVDSADVDTRQYYSETIISVIRCQSKRRTALSTTFYGGKKGMKARIFSIMDMDKKKSGAAVLCGALMLTLGTGAVFAAGAETSDQRPVEGENFAPTTDFVYMFLPDPEIYSVYSPYGITISEDGRKLLYNGRSVRLFVDDSDAEAFYSDDAGEMDLSVIRNTKGGITGIEQISGSKAQEYREAFFGNDINPNEDAREIAYETVAEIVQESAGKDKYKQYAAYGIRLSEDGGVLYCNGKRVRLFIDKLSDGSFETFWTDEAGTENLSAVRDLAGKIKGIESIPEEKAQKYFSLEDNET